MRTSSLEGNNFVRGSRSRVNAAFPEETRKQCLTPKCSFSSDRKRSNSFWPRKIPQTPDTISLAPIGVAAGGRVLPIRICALRCICCGSSQADVFSNAGSNYPRDNQRELLPITYGFLKSLFPSAFQIRQLTVEQNVIPIHR